MDYGNPPQRVTWCLTVSSLFVIRMKHLHHAYHIDRLAARFDILREQLESLIGSAADNLGEWSALLKSHRNGPRESNQRRIFTAKGTYLALWRASKDLNECCVYSQLANLLQNFIQCTCDLYTMYSLLYLNQISDIFGYILNVVATFAALGVVLAACENCKNQVGQMGQALHKRRGDEADWLATMIENFSLLLQHTPVCFSLGGFFDMDFMLLKEMAAAITTYMVIFIQFMPKDEPVTAPLANSTITPTSG
ncbi:gustatory receptor 8a-like [Anopheles nili]|uniref:gustatory receptor 8a-like n=1 Tax=Anopheles nili TaxID=185578 RepID=UPI00237B8F16|nr:gustatory receptor 8a-like [Anopheles nili]